ncbi:hypothetical protein C0995_004064 [Termitomyces sp. Mi166|nr:hypothetical protein C0995_004064 [Termitomyces sp. Mi166\
MAILPQRPLRGSRISTFYPVKSLPSLASLDSAFQLQEYISLLIRLDVHDVEAITSLPGKRAGKEKELDTEGEKSDDGEDGDEKGKIDPIVDEACWIYEQLRRLAQDLTHPLITMLQHECTRASCPEMKAGEWLYLCVAHGTDGDVEQCCAIDYILHTLDSATALLNTPRAFPSRIQIPQSSHRHFSSLARRLGRIFAHAYFHHREAFEQAEAESSLYARFLALTSKFDLVPSEFLVIPTPTNTDSDNDRRRRHDAHIPRLLPVAADLRVSGEGQWPRRTHAVPLGVETRVKSASPPRLSNGRGSESPRKMGRSRTDTMVLHDAYAVAEELAKASPKASPKVPPLEAIEEPMSPMDVEELPTTARPVVESLEEIGSSLPESPILHSPPPPSAMSLLAEPTQEVKQEEQPTSAPAEPPVAASKTEPTTTDTPVPAPVEADIAETTLESTGGETTPSITESKEAVEDPPKETKEVKEAKPLNEVVAEEVVEEAKAESTEALLPTEVPIEGPAPAPESTVEAAPAELEDSTPVPAQAEEEQKPTAVPAETETLVSETIVEIPDETEKMKEEAAESASEAKEKVEGKVTVEEADTPSTEEKVSAPATESDHS